MNEQNEPRGLYEKYRVQRADGTPTHENACYFVLRLDTDRHARNAARAYAASVRSENPELAEGLHRLLLAIALR